MKISLPNLNDMNFISKKSTEKSWVGRGGIGERPLMTSDFRIGRGSKITQKNRRYSLKIVGYSR